MSDAFVLVLMPASCVWQLLGGAGWPDLLPDPRPGSYDWTGLWWPARQGLDAEAKPFVPTACQTEACGGDVCTSTKLGVSLETPKGLPFEEVLGGGSVPDLVTLITAEDQQAGSRWAQLRPEAELPPSDGDVGGGLVKGLDPPQGAQVGACFAGQGGSMLSSLGGREAATAQQGVRSTCLASAFREPNESFQSGVPLPADAVEHQSGNVETGSGSLPAQTEGWIDHRVAIDAPWRAAQPSGSALAEQDGVVVKEEDGVDEALAVKAGLVLVIKALQRAGHSTKMAWGAYCDESANGVKDPDRHDTESLVCFMNSRREFWQIATELLP